MLLLISSFSADLPSLIRNGRPRSGLRRQSPAPAKGSQSQSSSEYASFSFRTDSGRTNTDFSETSTTDDYYTASTSVVGVGPLGATAIATATATTTTTSSWTKPIHHMVQTTSAGTAADGSSFESACSSVYSLARGEVCVWI